MKQSIHHVVPRIHKEASGTTYAVPRLCSSLEELGLDIHLHVVNASDRSNNYNLHVYPFLKQIESLGWSRQMRDALMAIGKADNTIIHNHSLWMMPNVYPGLVRKRNPKSKLVVSPHGTLSEFALNHSKWKKQLAYYLLDQKATLEYADLFHATSLAEVDDIRRQGYKQPIAYIPNGIDFVNQQSNIAGSDIHTILFLGRIHPIKGLENLLEAWSRIARSVGSNWQLVIAGPEGKAGYLKGLGEIIRDKAIPRVNLVGPVYEEEKYKLLAQAEIFIMPSHSENFSVTIAEALHQGTPVIASNNTPWEGLVEQQCGWWIDNSPTTLASCLQEVVNAPKEVRNEMGLKGQAWVKNAFAWEVVAKKMVQAYSWLLDQHKKPDFIIKD